jgi:hypothetical protein
MQKKTRRWTLIIAASLAVLLIAGFVAFQFAVRSLKGHIEKALGPQGEVKEIRVDLTGIEIIGVRIRAPRGPDKSWPAEDELRADRVKIVPALLDLLSARVVVRSIRIEGAYISMLRARDGGMRVLPGLLANKTGAPAAAGAGKKDDTPISIGKVELANGTIEFFDATIRQPPFKLRLEQINASIGKLQIPELKGESPLKVEGIVKGVRQDGRVSITGTIELASKESGLTTRLRGVDLVALQPYLIKAAETGVKKGVLDLELNSSVRKGRLHAPGTLTLSDLEVLPGASAGKLAGLPANAAIALMKNRKGKIAVRFVLDGDINDPHFSLNESMLREISTSLAEMLGVSVGGLAKGVHAIGSGATKGLGDTLNKLIKK